MLDILRLRLLFYVPLLQVIIDCSSSDAFSQRWVPLPHVDPTANLERRDVFLHTGSAAALSGGSLLWGISSSTPAVASPLAPETALVSSSSSLSLSSSNVRSVASIDSHVAIPVWPTWGGGRVVPVSSGLKDPFLLLAHHKHWFDPRDPLREPFKWFGKTAGLPYIDVEGFSMHPHRGFDILTYVLDGSDGFRHRDSLQQQAAASSSTLSSSLASRTYRGGSAQFMRTGSGIQHEEFWETRNDRRTNIELFQLWINLPGRQKFDLPFVEYIGQSTNTPWEEAKLYSTSHSEPVGTIRNIGATLTKAIDTTMGQQAKAESAAETNRRKQQQDEFIIKDRPNIGIYHTTIEKPGCEWMVDVPKDHSAMIYVREGTAAVSSLSSSVVTISDSTTGIQEVKALQSATFFNNGDSIVIRNNNKRINNNNNKLDVLLLTGEPLRESVAQGGPIVMNTQEEILDAYNQLQDGTFLNRDVTLRQHRRRLRSS